ncbi:hypothetical protein ACFXKG_40330 [Streptomyces sp. NPDC059255]|uniref:hypothetical protein n=1 Tax=Streptomyces sp. NPDC059255 TaxID=3346793 RepID=UPI0036C96CA8
MSAPTVPNTPSAPEPEPTPGACPDHRPPAPAAAPAPAGLTPDRVLFGGLVVLLACAFPAYLAYEHPAVREPLGIALAVLGTLGGLYAALRR